MNGNLISVVLATRNRAASLSRLLQGLVAQVDAPPFQVVVADNGSSDETSEVLKAYSHKVVLSSVFVERPGKGRALNEALRLADAEFIVFTDDDVLPDARWLYEWSLVFQRHASVDFFGGRIETDHNMVPAWVLHSHNISRLLTGEHDLGSSECQYRGGEYPFGPNMAVRYSRIKQYSHPYPENMGPGTSLPIGDETALFKRLEHRSGEAMIYAPGPVVKHEIEAENVRFISALKRCYTSGLATGFMGLAVSSDVVCGGAKTGIRGLIGRRLLQCRSSREFFCISARYLGYLRGRNRR